MKTLKDLVCCPPLMKEEIRTEAIEWIRNSTDQEHWLRFFNLTFEDLKGGGDDGKENN